MPCFILATSRMIISLQQTKNFLITFEIKLSSSEMNVYQKRKSPFCDLEP